MTTDSATCAQWVAAVADTLKLGPIRRLQPLEGGGNNRLTKVEPASGTPWVIKAYSPNNPDSHQRQLREFAFCSLLWERGFRNIPEPLHTDPESLVSAFGWLNGERVDSSAINGHAVRALAEFLGAINDELPPATAHFGAEACFSVRQHIECVDRRVEFLLTSVKRRNTPTPASDWIRQCLVPHWQRIQKTILGQLTTSDKELPAAQRWLSPSDFGFHNCLRTDRGQWQFFDFEHAGVDDPAKTVCDLFCQVQRPVAFDHLETFLSHALPPRIDAGLVAWRTRLLLPVYRVKWACICLNAFTTAGQARYRHVCPGADLLAWQHNRLNTAKRLLNDSR